MQDLIHSSKQWVVAIPQYKTQQYTLLNNNYYIIAINMCANVHAHTVHTYIYLHLPKTAAGQQY